MIINLNNYKIVEGKCSNCIFDKTCTMGDIYVFPEWCNAGYNQCYKLKEVKDENKSQSEKHQKD